MFVLVSGPCRGRDLNPQGLLIPRRSASWRRRVSNSSDNLNREPGCWTYECFTDATTGQVMWQEAFDDADAFLTHVQGLQESGLLEEFMGVYEID